MLPDSIARRIDWSTLKPVPTTLIDRKLAERRSDLLYAVMLDGRLAFIYVLLEHQSTSDRWMPLRLLGYMVRIWEKHVDQHPEAERLPVILPCG